MVLHPTLTVYMYLEHLFYGWDGYVSILAQEFFLTHQNSKNGREDQWSIQLFHHQLAAYTHIFYAITFLTEVKEDINGTICQLSQMEYSLELSQSLAVVIK